MKTAMQELIEIIKDKRKESDISNTLLRFCQVEAEKLLEKEKKQIIDFAIWFNNNDNSYKSYEEIVCKYYDSTFGDNPEAGI
jgi:hypothetical protein